MEARLQPSAGGVAATARTPLGCASLRGGVAALLLALLAPVSASRAESYAWVDEAGVTHITDDPEAIPEGARSSASAGRAGLRGLWSDAVAPGRAASRAGTGPDGAGRALPVRAGSRGDARTLRLLRGALEDLERGETARAAAALESVLRREPARPEAHWYLALLDRQRGRYASAEAHLRAFLAAAGDDLEPYRASAQRRLDALADERRLADTEVPRGSPRWMALASEHFRVSYDAELDGVSPGYADTVVRYLGEARRSAGQRLGDLPAGPMGVVFYGKATYLQAHRHRFTFQTVGFFDGRIHVVSAAHPAGELRSLLFHEYIHAVFREQTGGDRPYWLNEGLAELAERDSRGRGALTRSERAGLRSRIEEGHWIPLRRLAPSFAGLDDTDARWAYLQSAAAVAWLEARTESAERARLLVRLGTGASDDVALREVLGLDTAGLGAAVRAALREEFPPLPQILPGAPAR